MPAYVPEFVYGPTDQYCTTFGLVPWPDHLKPRETSTDVDTSSGVELTKKGEAYAEAALAEAGGVFFLTIDSRDRASIATNIERLINMLDDLDPDCDLEPDEGAEPWLGWPDRGPQQLSRDVPQDDREADCEDEGAQCEDEGAQCDDEGIQESGIADQDALDLLCFLPVEPLRFDGKGKRDAKDMLRRVKGKRGMVAAKLAKMPRGGDRKSEAFDQTANLRNDQAAEMLNVRPMLSEDPWPRRQGLTGDDFGRLPWA